MSRRRRRPRPRLVALAVLGALAFATASAPRDARAAFDPDLEFRTLETPHFRISYHSGERLIAEHVADIGESIHADMTTRMGWSPRPKTEIVLTDPTDSANGSATALPYNAVRLLVTAPDDMSPLGDVDDWYLTLVTHEYTHVLHTDHVRGIPAIANAILGKTFAPNQVQPRWILEGYGVYMESARTSGGRLRSSMWDMYMRADVLEGRVASLDQVSASVRRWPQGNLWYLYGSHFIDWIARTHGEKALRAIAKDYGTHLVPWGFNRSARRATGQTYEELWPEWIASLRARYGAQADRVRARGLREGVRLTHHGQIARYPRFVPKGAFPGHEGDVLYFRDDAHSRSGLVALPLVRARDGQVLAGDEKHAELLVRTPNESVASFGPDGGLVFSNTAYSKGVFPFLELFRVAPGDTSAWGLDGQREQLTRDFRATDPTVSPDGRTVVFVANERGTRRLLRGRLGPSGVTDVRPLVESGAWEQAYTPRFSPDGNLVAWSAWRTGGRRDVRVVDLRTGAVRDVTDDRAVDGSPSFSPDGKTLYFHSDRTGIPNVYAHDLATGRLRQVTNVLSGAYQPEPSPDGKSLVYVGYTSYGYDLFALPLDEGGFLEAEPYVDARPPVPTVRPAGPYVSEPYSPLSTLAPRRFSVDTAPSTWGQSFSVTAAGSDIAGLHSVVAAAAVETRRADPTASIAYSYGRRRFDVSVSAFRQVAARGGFAIGDYEPVVAVETVGVASGVSWALPGPFDGQAASLTYSASRVGVRVPLDPKELDPFERPNWPKGGVVGVLALGWSYSNAERYLWSVSPERGFGASLSLNVTDPALGSQYAGWVATSDVSAYVPMPWLRHHVLAVHGGAGASGGAFPGRGAFYVGGFVDVPVVDVVRNGIIQGGFVLRGYEPVAASGRTYALTNLEYRFPILNVDRGPSTLPIFFNRVSGNVFFDYGGAFDDFSASRFKSGVGGELWLDSVLGYVAGFSFRLGYARGLASRGLDKVYFVGSVPF